MPEKTQIYSEWSGYSFKLMQLFTISKTQIKFKLKFMGGRCFIASTKLAPHIFMLGWLKLNLMLLLDQLRLA